MSHSNGGSVSGGGLQQRLAASGPNMLPEEISLIGRKAELDQLLTDAKRRLSTPGPIQSIHISITGVAGVGKSALGVALAHRLRQEYPDGALYLDVLRQSGDTSQHLRMFLEALGRRTSLLPPDASLPNEFIRTTDRKRIIVFLDNVTDYDLVRDLIPHSPSCLVILTSLERLRPDIAPLNLKRMQVESAAELFRAFAPSRLEPGAVPDKVLVKLLEACAGLPVAIRPLAAVLEDDPSYTLASALKALTTYRYESVIGPDPEASFRISYDRLPDVQAMLFRQLSVVPGESFDISVAAHLAGDVSPSQARECLDQLRRLELIERTRDEDYFTMHSLLRQFAGKLLGAEKASEVVRSLLNFYWHQAESNNKAIRSLIPINDGVRKSPSRRAQQISRDRDRALEWMEKQHRNLVAAVRLACKRGLTELAWQISSALVEFFEIRGVWGSWEQTHLMAKSILAEDSIGMAHISYGLGRLYGSRRKWSKAIKHYRTAIAIFRQHELNFEVGRSLNSLGDVYRYMRNFDAAKNCFTCSLDILEHGHHPRQVAIAKRSMAAIHRLRGEFDEAERLCREAIGILEDQHDERWIAATKLSLADIYLDRDMEARGLLEDCLAVFKIFGDTHWLLLTQRSLGEALRKDRDYRGAMALLQRCQESLDSSRDVYWEGEVFHSIGQVHLDTDNLEEARESFVRAMKRFERAGDTLWQGRTYVSLGHVAAKAGELDKALASCHSAWPLLIEQGANADLERLEDDMQALQDELQAEYHAPPNEMPPDASDPERRT